MTCFADDSIQHWRVTDRQTRQISYDSTACTLHTHGGEKALKTLDVNREQTRGHNDSSERIKICQIFDSAAVSVTLRPNSASAICILIESYISLLQSADSRRTGIF